MKKKVLISLISALLLVCIVAAGVFATGTETEFKIYSASLTLGTDLRLNFKLTLPAGVSENDVKLLVWEGDVISEDTNYTKDTKTAEGNAPVEVSFGRKDGELYVFTFDGINAAEMGKTIYARAYYVDTAGATQYTQTVRYSVAEYLNNRYNSDDATEKEKAVIDALAEYGDAAQELNNEGEPLPKISDGVVKITVSGGKFADGFTCGKFLSGEKLSVVADSTESAPMLTAELGEGWLWTMADGKLGYEAEAEYYDGIYIGKYENAFEVTVGENTEIHTDKTLAEVFALANGGTVKLLADVDMGKYDIILGLEEEITLDLNGKNIISDYLFNIYDATLTVQDSVGGGSITTTEETVFFLNVESSVLTIEGGTFTGATYAVYVANGKATINGGTFSSDPSAYVEEGYIAEYDETNENWFVRAVTEAEYVAEVTVGETTTNYTSLAAAFANANGGTVKLLKDVDMGESNISLGNGAETTLEITLDLNGKNITSDYLFDIYNAELTVKDSVGGGSVTTTAVTVFLLDAPSSVLTIESGTFTGATYAVYVGNGTATIKGGTFTGNIFAIIANGGTISITGGTFSKDPSAYVANGYVAVYDASNENWLVRAATEAEYVAEVTVGETTTKYTFLAAAFANANGGTVKLLKDVDMVESNIQLGRGAETTIEITLDLNGKNITSDYLFDIYNAELTVKDSVGGGSVTTTAQTVFYLNVESSVLTIESGEFTGATYAVYVSSGTATIKGGTFTGENHAVQVNDGTATIKGGTFSKDPSAYVAGSDENAKFGYVAVYDETNENWLVRAATEADYVAAVTVGETTTNYTSLAAAFANANGGTVKLLSDVDMVESNIQLGRGAETTIEITLDLNGKKITSSSAYLFYIYNAELTVQDSVGGGSATTTGATVFFINDIYSVLTIESGTFTDEIHVSAGEVQIKDGTFKSVFVESGKAEISGGTFDGAYAVYVGGGEVTISGGTFKGKNNAVQVNGGTFTINNGTFDGEYYAVYVGGGTLNVNGGTFTSNTHAVCVESDMANITITDGAFTSDYDAIKVFENGDVTLSVRGGTFSFNPIAYVNPGVCVVDDNGDGTWTVKKSS